MNKKGQGDVIILFLGIMLISLFLMIYTSGDERKEKVDNFCKNNGFETSDIAIWRFEKSVCIRIEGSTIFESEIDRCGDTWCFVKVSGKKKDYPMENRIYIENKDAKKGVGVE